MNYKLRFEKRALKEWDKLDNVVKEQFKIKLAERLKTPRVSSAQLRGFTNCYKIKLRALGYRLLYCVHDESIEVLVLTIARRDQVYEKLAARLNTIRLN